MGDRMQPLPFEQLLDRMTEEYRIARSVFGIHESLWHRPDRGRSVAIAGERCATPLGPAAGPHTQLAQNIVSAYLTGSRFIELKTVQILDALEIEKPCIDAFDEGYNTEWSTELSLNSAWEEYAKAWILLHLVEELWHLRPDDAPRSFMFNMSVGYDLAGIQSPEVQRCIDRMLESSGEPRFQAWLRAAQTAQAAQRAPEIDGRICGSVTLSTMHGCPPDEIESICRHLIEDKGLHTFVKLNPTLLGYDRVRETLSALGYDYIMLDRASFDHDLRYDTAIEVLARLREVAAAAGKQFGVKLTNTLPTVNRGGRLPGDQMYMSGRALYPLSISLAARLSEEFDGTLPISYSGGIDAQNIAEVFACGIKPITVCTTLLKPGGYTRQKQLAELLTGSAEGWERSSIDVSALSNLAERARHDRRLGKEFRGTEEVRIEGTLPRFDCYRAPCVAACPIAQNVPEYIRLVGEERYAEALELIYERNALPAITGHICDHQCEHACTRLEYDGCLNIRELKKIAAQHGFEHLHEHAERPKASAGAEAPHPARGSRDVRCAVVGAGPAGLSSAYFLAREGFEVTVFEREANAGGVVRNVIPAFRLPQEAVEQDIAFIAEHGVEFRFGVDPQTLTAERLRAEGYGPIVLAIGAEVGNDPAIAGDDSRVVRSLDFLWAFRGNARRVELGRRVVVVGGGNTAMDAARATYTLPEVEQVTVLYRRSEAEMPADREEYHNAVADGVQFRFLRNPEHIAPDGTVTVRVMELGEPDSSGRRRPVATEHTETITAETLITAIGERVDPEALARFGLTTSNAGTGGGRAGGTRGSRGTGSAGDTRGTGGEVAESVDPETLETALPELHLAGDALTGPSTVVRCIAAGRRVSDAIADRHGGRVTREPPKPQLDSAERYEQLRERKATLRTKPAADGYHDERAFAEAECHRCLECSYICNKCEEVCPNRANLAVEILGEVGRRLGLQHAFRDPYQIVHLDALCNECGNCDTFCPWSERVPYRDKPTVFSSRRAFEHSTNDGWLLEGDALTVRFNGAVRTTTASAAEAPRSGEAATGLGAPRAAAPSDTGTSAAPAGAQPTDEERFMQLFALLHRERPSLFALIDEPAQQSDDRDHDPDAALGAHAARGGDAALDAHAARGGDAAHDSQAARGGDDADAADGAQEAP